MRKDIDGIIEYLNDHFPEIKVRQLEVKHPGADDDGIWFFTHPSSDNEVQLESWNGQYPFIAEDNDSDERQIIPNLCKALEMIQKRLKLQ